MTTWLSQVVQLKDKNTLGVVYVLHSSILDFPSRGKWGNASYRGNCSGHIIKGLLEHYQPKKFVEVFSGGGTGQDVCNELGLKIACILI